MTGDQWEEGVAYIQKRTRDREALRRTLERAQAVAYSTLGEEHRRANAYWTALHHEIYVPANAPRVSSVALEFVATLLWEIEKEWRAGWRTPGGDR